MDGTERFDDSWAWKAFSGILCFRTVGPSWAMLDGVEPDTDPAAAGFAANEHSQTQCNPTQLKAARDDGVSCDSRGVW
ncbi:hypothetical protein C8A05DRAFT_29031 [Staphylotrichum tortipilum]|uniref:Uncharacterized protein n=1 Tax=Staphylotrichum tortipilum TaxID=2831512 RepID=A0AAN6MW47_9PEZI|nr:hypothetical protein C8A05DRAFT_29031 [Staphylotrichum longicolle]